MILPLYFHFSEKLFSHGNLFVLITLTGKQQNFSFIIITQAIEKENHLLSII